MKQIAEKLIAGDLIAENSIEATESQMNLTQKSNAFVKTALINSQGESSQGYMWVETLSYVELVLENRLLVFTSSPSAFSILERTESLNFC